MASSCASSAAIDLQVIFALRGLAVKGQVQAFQDKLLLDPINLALTHAQHGRDVAGAGAFGAAPGLVAVEQYQGIDDLGRCVRAFACDALQFGSFLSR